MSRRSRNSERRSACVTSSCGPPDVKEGPRMRSGVWRPLRTAPSAAPMTVSSTDGKQSRSVSPLFPARSANAGRRPSPALAARPFTATDVARVPVSSRRTWAAVLRQQSARVHAAAACRRAGSRTLSNTGGAGHTAGAGRLGQHDSCICAGGAFSPEVSECATPACPALRRLVQWTTYVSDAASAVAARQPSRAVRPGRCADQRGGRALRLLRRRAQRPAREPA